jgi:hypothetical protein
MIWFVALGMVVQAGINWWLIQRARAARNDNRTLVRSLDTAQRVAAQAVTPEELQTKLTVFGLAWEDKLAGWGREITNGAAIDRETVSGVEARVTALEQRAAAVPPKKEPAPRRAATGAQAMRMIETAVAAETKDDADKQDVGREG